MKNQTIIHLVGQPGVGKTTIADIITSESFMNAVGVTVNTVSFAEPVRELVGTLLDIKPALLITQTYKDRYYPAFTRTGRELMVAMTEFGFSLNPNIWWEKALQKIDNMNEEYIVIPDCRYGSWFSYLERYYGGQVKVLRVCTYQQDNLPIGLDIPPSIQYEKFMNNGNLEQLEYDLVQYFLHTVSK